MKKYIKFILLFILVLSPISILGEENNLVNDVSTKACNVSITDISILDENNSESKQI